MKINVHFTKSVGTKEVGASPEITLSLLNRMGLDGKSAYEIAVLKGFEGSEEKWLESLIAPSTEAMRAALEAEQAANASAICAEAAAKAAENSSRDVKNSTAAATSAQTAVAEAAQHAGISAANATAAADAAEEAQEYAAESARAALEAAAATGILESELGRVREDLDAKISATASAVYKGVRTLGGKYVAANPAIDTGNTVTIELLFTTGDNVSAQQSLISGEGIDVRIKSSTLACTLGTPDFTLPNIEVNTTYHFVLTANWDNLYRRAYLNGKLIKDMDTTTWFSTLRGIGLGDEAFRGIIHHCRIFSEVFSHDMVRRLWNEACPHLYSLPESFLPANSGTCLAQYIPQSISQTGWADTSGNGFGLIAEGAALPSNTAPLNMSYRMLTSGLVTSNGNISISLRVPAGYFVDQIVFTNYNDRTMDTIKMSYLQTQSIIVQGETVQALGTWACNPMATGRPYVDNDYIFISGKNNTLVGGCKVDIRVVSI